MTTVDGQPVAEPQGSGLASLRRPICIVGAGPSGLIAGRALKRAGIPFDIVEQHTDLGGIWNIDQPGSPLYESCNFIAHRRYSGFIGFPFPDHYPDYPTWWQVRDYVHAFAAAYDLAGHVTCGRRVVDATPVTDEVGSLWRVTFETGQIKDYRGVIWACGQQQTPVMPSYPGMERFKGQIIHSRDHSRGEQLTGRKVLVVGGGNSGVDLACDAAAFASHASWSIRRGYWFWPKLVFGRPMFDFLQGGAALPKGYPDVSTMSRDELLEILVGTLGDPASYGLPQPVAPPSRSRPIINEQALHYIAHGRLDVRPDIAEILPGGVRFVDGSEADYDHLIFATGYRIDIPWMRPNLLDHPADKPMFHLGTFAHSTPGLYAVGMAHLAGPFYVLWDKMAQLIVGDIQQQNLAAQRGVSAREIRHEPTLDIRGPQPGVNNRNILQVDVALLEEALAKLSASYGIEMPSGLWDMEFYASTSVTSGLDRAEDSANAAQRAS